MMCGIRKRSLNLGQISDRYAQIMFAFFGVGIRVQQIAAKLADILKQCRLVARAIVPELGRGESFAQNDRTTA
jgi:hypothetical protein